MAIPYNILHVLKGGGTDFAGPVRMVIALARIMDRRCWTLHAALLRDDGPLGEELRQAGVRTTVIGWSGDRNDPRGAWRFFRYLHRQRFHIVHQHFGGVSGRILARAAGVGGIVLHLHSRVLESFGPARATYSCWVADKVIATSQAVAQCARRPANVVHPGVIMPQPLTHQRRRELTVGTAARLVPLKGIACLIEAIALLRAECPVRLEIAGEGPERDALEKQVARLALVDDVVFLGWRSNLHELFSSWDVFVLSSLEEAFGMAALEAMAAGLPVVASDVGGVPELISDRETGLLVPPGDATALAGALRQLARSPDFGCNLGRAAAERARGKFSVEQMVHSLVAIYESIGSCEYWGKTTNQSIGTRVSKRNIWPH